MAVQQQINKFLQGIGASPGIVIGKAYLVERFKVRLPEKRIEAEQVEAEIGRFLKAIQESREQIVAIKEKIHQRHGHLQLDWKDDHPQTGEPSPAWDYS